MYSLQRKLNNPFQLFNSKRFIKFAAIGVSVLVGYFQYVDSYQFPKWKVFLSGVIMGAPFSFGLFISTLKLGKRFKFFTIALILFSAFVRSLLLLPPTVSAFIFLIELYAIWSLFQSRKIYEKSFYVKR